MQIKYYLLMFHKNYELQYEKIKQILIYNCSGIINIKSRLNGSIW